ncbi:membrane-targeted effector domain-containing toxin [Pseudomonas sp. Z18(2022)]|uniref:membrane-targeted effector domain-containing toxin n=1 Tax=Pseudomonas sp. Z18(2022) TaxID=2983410 RepID=UPI002E812871|nr:membrane-targeted effector domain-containing toxin [Pseudomonas sp. Z18(2022)]
MVSPAVTPIHRPSIQPPAFALTSAANITQPAPLPGSTGIPPEQRSTLAGHFNVGDQQAFITQHNSLALAMQKLHGQQPNFKDVQLQQVAAMLADQPHLNPATLTFKRWIRQSDGIIKTLSEQPLLEALDKKIAELSSQPWKNTDEGANVQSGIFSQGKASQPPALIDTTHSLSTIAQHITTQYPEATLAFWTTPRPSKTNPLVLKAPQDELLTLHKRQLSTLAALRASDGTLSPAGKQLIDAALQYPTLAERENVFADGARPGVYPLTLDDGTERGALLAGTFLITQTDGAFSTPPTWPKGRSLALDEANGPVVLYTPGEGFEEFATPAQARETLAQRLDQGAIDADLLLQTLPLSLQNRPNPPTGDDLMLRVEPLAGDVLAEGIPQLLKRQQAEINASFAKISTQLTYPLHPVIDEAADWSYLLDGSNAMQARNQKLADKLQPDWLKNLPPVKAALFAHLERAEEKSASRLRPLLEKITTLPNFARDRMNEAIQKQYPTAQVDADKLMVQVQTNTRIHTGRPSGNETRSVQNRELSLTDLALKNPTEFPAGESGKHTQVTFTLPLKDTQGKPILDANGNPVTLDTDQLKTLVNTADAGGEYTELLGRELATDTDSGRAGEVRSAWKANLADLMEKEAFLAELNPDAYKTAATTNTTTKRGAQWVAAVLKHPHPANRAQVDGKTIVANAFVQNGLTVQGVMVIGNQSDSPLVLYTPDSPDGVVFREVADQSALNALMAKKEWQLYTANRKSPVEKDSVTQLADRANSNWITTFTNPQITLANLLINAPKTKDIGNKLKPISENIQDELYKQQVKMLIDNADAQSISSAEVAAQSKTNKIQFGIEVASIFLDLLPVAGKGVSLGIRLGKAGVKALRANTKVLPALIKNPALGRLIYADFATSAAGIPLYRSPPLRPVTAATRTVPRALPAPSGPGSSTQALPNRDLSAYAVPNELIQGRPLRPDGTYNVGDNWYIRFTDSTGTNKVYQIDSAFHARSGMVNIVDPSAPLTVPKSSRIKASLLAAGNGEWRLSELPGGRRHRGRASPPLDEYLNRVITGSGAGDFNADAATIGQLRRWFQRDMNDFYTSMASGQMPARPQLPPIGVNATPKSIVQDALAQADVKGLVLGELHDEPASFQFLIDQMQTLKNAGVTTIYLEGGLFLQRGPGFGAGAYALEDAIYAPRLYDEAYSPNSPTTLDVINAADKHGIKVIGLEHRELTFHSDNRAQRSTNVRFYEQRLQELNYAATQIINQTPAGEKFVAVVGNAHMNTYENVPGISELTGSVGVSISPTPKGDGSIVSQPPYTPPPPLKLLQGMSNPEPIGDIHIDYNIDKITL